MEYGTFKNEVDMDDFVDRFKYLIVDKVGFEFDADDIFEFLNARVRFYKKEYHKMKSNQMYAPIALYNAIYNNPGCENPEDISETENSMDVMMFNLHILNLIKYITVTKESV